MYLGIVTLFACILLTICNEQAFNFQLNEVICEQNLHCNQTKISSCCLISKSSVIKKDNVQVRPTERRANQIRKIFFEPNLKVLLLPSYLGYTFPRLTVYIARKCAILMIERSNFDGLKKLKTLDLSSNKITVLQHSPFDDLVSLEEIFLGKNYIKFMDIGIFDKSPGLINVNLTENICIDNAFHGKEWRLSLQSKCQRREGIPKLDLKLFAGPCDLVKSEYESDASATSETASAGSIQGGTPGHMGALAALYYRTTSAIAGQYFCAANLITLNHFLTAAHCIQPKYDNLTLKPENIVAVVGQAYLTEQLNSTESAYEISDIAVHPNWNPSESKYTGDIAVLTTSTVIFDSYILGINRAYITRSNKINRYFFGLVGGWGDGQAGPPYKGVMRTVNVTAVPSEVCFAKDHALGEIFARRMFCAGGKGEGPCAGASGGGFFVRVNDDWFLRGIVSSATLKNDLSCDVNRYTLYTRVSDYADWIEEVVEKSCFEEKFDLEQSNAFIGTSVF